MSMDVDEDLSATVTLMITMPSSVPSSRKPARSPQDIEDGEDEGEPPPYVEFGLADVQIPRGVFDLDSHSDSTTPIKHDLTGLLLT
jgi:hypothetical protein